MSVTWLDVTPVVREKFVCRWEDCAQFASKIIGTSFPVRVGKEMFKGWKAARIISITALTHEHETAAGPIKVPVAKICVEYEPPAQPDADPCVTVESP